MSIRRIGAEDFEALVELVDKYRVFYRKESSKSEVRQFLRKIMSRNESIIYGAFGDKNVDPARMDMEGRLLGFVQLYMSYSTVSLAPLWVLNDLYVEETARNQGIASKLIKHALYEGEVFGAKGVALETQVDNKTAQRVYERLGFIKNELAYFYEFSFQSRQVDSA